MFRIWNKSVGTSTDTTEGSGGIYPDLQNNPEGALSHEHIYRVPALTIMIINHALTVIGIFLVGAAAGGVLKYARYRSLLVLCDDLTKRTDESSDVNRLLSGKNSAEHASTVVVAPTYNEARGEYQVWATNLLTCLGAPIWDDHLRRRLTMSERIEWLQARYG